MKGRWLWIVIGANLLVLVALAFVYPDLMVSPGHLRSEHTALATDCFACHAPLRGPTAERCIACHAVADIGLRTSKGVLIEAGQAKPSKPLKISFHQELTESNCMACHSEHARPKLSRRIQSSFSHALLRAGTRDRCEVCHQAPTDTLHRQIKGNCAQCHASKAWKPATFEHGRLFLLDGAHNVDCSVCHVGGDVSRYTCYGCHEHTRENMRSKHREEGISDLSDCVRCHRSAREGRGDD